MPRSLLDQMNQVAASVTYDDVLANSHVVGTAEGQVHIEGDLNVMRTNVKDLKGTPNWFDNTMMSVDGIASKQFIYKRHESGFDNVSVSGASTYAFDAAIKGITGNAMGAGTSLIDGVILNSTLVKALNIRDALTDNPIDDAANNQVYSRLTLDTTPFEENDDNNQLSGYASITGISYGVNTDANNRLYLNVVDDTGGFFHVDIYKDAARSLLVAHTATYNSTGAKALVADNTSGIGGTITVDAVTAVDSDIQVTISRYKLSFYSMVSNVETVYTFAAPHAIDLSYVLFSENFKDLPWDQFLDIEFHDVVGPVGTITDDMIVVDGMAFLLNGLVTQAQVNDKLDKLGSTANGEGASGIMIEDADSWYTGDDIETVLNEIQALFGSTTSATYDFTENNVLDDNDAVYPALEKLDLKFGDLASVADGEGASLVGIEDDGGYTTQTNVEEAIQEIYQKLLDVSGWQKAVTTTVGVIPANTDYTIPGSLSYTPASGGINMDVYLNGQLLFEGAGNDYIEVAGAPSTKIQFLFAVPVNRNLTFMVRK